MTVKSIVIDEQTYKRLTKDMILLGSKNYDSLLINLMDEFQAIINTIYKTNIMIERADALMKGKKSERKNEKLRLILEMLDDILKTTKLEESESILRAKMRIERYLDGQKKVSSNDLHKEQNDLPEPVLE